MLMGMENSIRRNLQSLLRSSPVAWAVRVANAVQKANAVLAADDPVVLMLRVEIRKAIARNDQTTNR